MNFDVSPRPTKCDTCGNPLTFYTSEELVQMMLQGNDPHAARYYQNHAGVRCAHCHWVQALPKEAVP